MPGRPHHAERQSRHFSAPAPIVDTHRVQIHPRSDGAVHPVPDRRHRLYRLQGITADHYEEAKKLADRIVTAGRAAFSREHHHESRPAGVQGQGGARSALLRDGQEGDHRRDLLWAAAPDRNAPALTSRGPSIPTCRSSPTIRRRRRRSSTTPAGSPVADGIREKNGVRLAFTNSTTAGNHVREQAQQLLQQIWSEIGADMQIKNMPAAVIWGDY